MSRDPAKQAAIEARLSKFSSKAYNDYAVPLKNGTYRVNRGRWAKNRSAVSNAHRTIRVRMESGKAKKGNEGKKEKLNAILEMMNANTNSEGDSAAVEHAAAIAQGSAEKLAKQAIVKEKRKTFKVVAPKVNVMGGAIECLVPEQVPHITRLFETLLVPQVQRDLIGLYADSQAEFSKKGKLTQEIGMSRERDILAVLQDHLGPELRTDIDNSLVEDCLYGTARISIKHSSAQYGAGSAKAKWCSDESVGKAYIDKMIKLDPTHYTHLMMIYIDMNEKSKSKGMISIAFVTDLAIMRIVEELRERAFILRTGTDTRGVEYSREMIVKMLEMAAFVIQMENINLVGGVDPIVRRRQLLHVRRAQAPPPAQGRLGPGGGPEGEE